MNSATRVRAAIILGRLLHTGSAQARALACVDAVRCESCRPRGLTRCRETQFWQNDDACYTRRALVDELATKCEANWRVFRVFDRRVCGE